MCFSASASFAISGVLLITGIASVKKVRTKSEIPFAAIPLIFAAQQFTEGVLWLSLTSMSFEIWYWTSTYFFLFIAQSIWPIWVPYSMYLIEPDSKRKKILLSLVFVGIITSTYLTTCLVYYGAQSTVHNYHIGYNLNYPKYLWHYSGILYFIPTVIPAFICSLPKMGLLAGLLLSSFILSKIMFDENVVSVWCFFAAGVSITIYYIMRELNPSTKVYELVD